MSADFNTFIEMKGTPEEIKAMIAVIKDYCDHRRDGVELLSPRICQKTKEPRDENIVYNKQAEKYLTSLSEEELDDFLAQCSWNVFIEAGGPYGNFDFPWSTGLFEALAVAAPQAYFEGNIDGFTTGADVGHWGRLENGVLHLLNFDAVEGNSVGYAEYVRKTIPYSKFCELFRIDTERFTPEIYSGRMDFECDYILGQALMDETDSEEFKSYFECPELDEEQFDRAVAEVRKLADFASYSDDITEKYTYDPITKEYAEVCDTKQKEYQQQKHDSETSMRGKFPDSTPELNEINAEMYTKFLTIFKLDQNDFSTADYIEFYCNPAYEYDPMSFSKFRSKYATKLISTDEYYQARKEMEKEESLAVFPYDMFIEWFKIPEGSTTISQYKDYLVDRGQFYRVDGGNKSEYLNFISVFQTALSDLKDYKIAWKKMNKMGESAFVEGDSARCALYKKYFPDDDQ